MKNSLPWLWLVSNRYKDNVNGWSGGGIWGGVPLAMCGHLCGCVLGRRNKERRLEKVKFTLCGCGWSRAGWDGQGSRKAFAHLQGFLLLYKQVLYFHVSYFGFLVCRVGMSFLQRPENVREGREVWHWNHSEWSSWWMNLLPNFKQIYLLPLLFLTQLYEAGFLSICTNRYTFINCPIMVEGLLSQQGPFFGKTVQWLKSISAPPSPSPPLPTDSIAQSIIVVRDLVNFCLKRWPFSWSRFILIIDLILHFPVHYLIWQQPCEEGSHGHYFPKGISDNLWNELSFTLYFLLAWPCAKCLTYFD